MMDLNKTQDRSVEELTVETNKKVLIEARNVNVFYGHFQALKDINLTINENSVTAFIGPSGYIEQFHIKGEILIDQKKIYWKGVAVEELRKEVGMVFQKPNPFPKTIFENVAYGLKIHGVKDKNFIEERVVKSLKDVALWDEVKDDLKKSALALSGGQQQRLCIARTLAVEPKIILMDEPTSALDPISTAKIEELLFDLKQKYTIVIVTHNMQQAARISDKTAFFYMGDLVEYDDTKTIFTNPKQEKTQNYITGRFG